MKCFRKDEDYERWPVGKGKEWFTWSVILVRGKGLLEFSSLLHDMVMAVVSLGSDL